MPSPTTPVSPQTAARLSGVLYLIIIVLGIFAETVRDQLVVSNDAAATAANIVRHALLFRIGIVADLSTFLLAIALTMILCGLLRRVNPLAAWLFVAFNLAQDAIGGANVLTAYAPLQLLGSATYLKVIPREQLEAFALFSLKTQAIGFSVALIFFGFSCLALGYLIARSTFLPRTLGVLIVVAGSCYLINGFALIISPRFNSMLVPAVLIPAFIGELSLALWLTVRGLDVAAWQAATARTPAAM